MYCAVCFSNFGGAAAGTQCCECKKCICVSCAVKCLKAKLSISEYLLRQIPKIVKFNLTELFTQDTAIDTQIVYPCPYCRKENILTDINVIKNYCLNQTILSNKFENIVKKKHSNRVTYYLLHMKAELTPLNSILRNHPTISHFETFAKPLKTVCVFLRKEKLNVGTEFKKSCLYYDIPISPLCEIAEKASSLEFESAYAESDRQFKTYRISKFDKF